MCSAQGLEFRVSEHGNLLVGEGAFHAIFVIAKPVVFLIFVVIGFFWLVELT